MAMATMKEVFPYSAMVFTIRDLKILFHLRGSHDQESVNGRVALAAIKWQGGGRMEQRSTEWLGTLKLWRHQVVKEGKKTKH